MIAHQVVLRLAPDTRPNRSGLAIALSCTCAPYTEASLRGGRPRHVPIETRMPFPLAEAMAAYRQWHLDHGKLVQP